MEEEKWQKCKGVLLAHFSRSIDNTALLLFETKQVYDMSSKKQYHNNYYKSIYNVSIHTSFNCRDTLTKLVL